MNIALYFFGFAAGFYGYKIAEDFFTNTTLLTSSMYFHSFMFFITLALFFLLRYIERKIFSDCRRAEIEEDEKLGKQSGSVFHRI